MSKIYKSQYIFRYNIMTVKLQSVIREMRLMVFVLLWWRRKLEDVSDVLSSIQLSATSVPDELCIEGIILFRLIWQLIK